MAELLKELESDLGSKIKSLDKFEMQQVLGKGGFGEVWKAKHLKSGKMCAVKLLNFSKNDKDDVEMFTREVKILAEVRHLFLLKLLGYSTKEPFFIVTPYIPSGSLFDYVCSSGAKKELNDSQKQTIAIGIAYGMMRLHEMDLIHRDLKSPNILIDSKGNPIICDFGIARHSASMMTKDIGTSNWMAPEQMASHHYTNKVDVYAYGCILYEMLCHQMPFEDLTPFKVAANVIEGRRPELPKKQPSICRLIQKCWAQEPEDRPSFYSILKGLVRLKYVFEKAKNKEIEKIMNHIYNEDSKGTPLEGKIKEWISTAVKPGEKAHHKK